MVGRGSRTASVEFKVKVLMVGTLPGDASAPIGGVQSAMLHLCEALSQRDDLELTVVSFGTAPAYSTSAAYRVISEPHLRSLGTQHRIRSVVAEHAKALSVDVVHAQGRATMLPDFPATVLTIHGIIEQDTRHERSGLRGQAFRLLEVRPEVRDRNRTRNVISISPYVDQILPPLATRRLWHIPNAVSVVVPATTHAPGHPRFIMAGVIGPRKGLKYLISALGRAKEKLGAYELIVAGRVGDLSYKEECEAIARDSGVARHITWLGNTDQATLARLVRDSTALVLPSLQETAPMVIAESMSVGTPVIATDVGGVADMVGDEGAGILVPIGDEVRLADALVRMSQQADPSPQRLAALKASEPFRSDRVAAATAACYLEVLATGG